MNYLAGFLLTRLVLEKIKAAAPARIVNVASAGQEPLDFSNLQLERDYSGYFAYCRSKVALIMFTLDLAEELEDAGVTVFAHQTPTRCQIGARLQVSAHRLQIPQQTFTYSAHPPQ